MFQIQELSGNATALHLKEAGKAKVEREAVLVEVEREMLEHLTFAKQISSLRVTTITLIWFWQPFPICK